MAAPMKMKQSATLINILRFISSREQNCLTRNVLSCHASFCRERSTKAPVTVIKIDTEITNTSPKTTNKAQKISRAMRAYLEKAKRYEVALEEQMVLYDMGKRHLANIMGRDPTDFTVKDMKDSIEYLLPSGLHEPKARPVMPSPSEVLPLQRVARFGSDGRPFSPFFYTGKTVLNEHLYALTSKLQELKAKEDAMARKGQFKQIHEKQIKFIDSQWMKFDRFKVKMRDEKLTENEYNNFLKYVERLMEHPLNYQAKELIMNYRSKLDTGVRKKKKPPPKRPGNLEEHQIYAKAHGSRKRSIAKVDIIEPGTGQFSVNGKSILYFEKIADREQILFPLVVTDKLGEVDITAKVKSGGTTGQAGAIRLAISRALSNIVDKETLEKMRLAGLLTRDPRNRERKKPFKRGARKSRTWKKR